MSDFVDRLERELLAAGRRPRPHRVARRLSAHAMPVLLSVAAAGIVAAVIVIAATTRERPVAPAARPVGPVVSTASKCRLRNTGDRAVLQALVRSKASPSAALVSQVGVLRQQATTADHVNLRQLDRWPYEVLAVYMRYIRVLSGPHGARIALLPASVCSSPLPAPFPTRIRPVPHDVLLMQIISNPASFRPTIYVGTGADIPAGQANGYLDNPVPQGKSGVRLLIVPDGVVRVVLRYQGHRPAATIPIHGNVGIANPVPQLTPIRTTWYSPNGRVIRTFNH
jgi:hypothetical protein